MPLAIKNCSAVAQSRGKAALRQDFQIEEALERLKFRAESGCALRRTSAARPAIRSAVDNRTLKDALWIAHGIPMSFPGTLPGAEDRADFRYHGSVSGEFRVASPGLGLAGAKGSGTRHVE